MPDMLNPRSKPVSSAMDRVARTVLSDSGMLRAFCVQNRDFWSITGCEKVVQPIDLMVGVAGFEPATPASRTQCSTGLSHTPTRTRLIALGFAHRKQPN